MKYEIKKVVFDFSGTKSQTMKVLDGCIPGATPYHHTVLKGSTLELEPGEFLRATLVTATAAAAIAALIPIVKKLNRKD